ncbi:MAG: hypothetical protein Q9204_007944, partial [Flavoplaca sp. TL-2023a]
TIIMVFTNILFMAFVQTPPQPLDSPGFGEEADPQAEVSAAAAPAPPTMSWTKPTADPSPSSSHAAPASAAILATSSARLYAWHERWGRQ